MKLVIRKYKFATLAEYFDDQVEKSRTPHGSPGHPADRDTHAKMGARLGTSTTTIARIVAGLADPSFALALAISRDANVDPAGMGKSGLKKAA